MKEEKNLSLNELRGLAPIDENSIKSASPDTIAETMQDKHDITPPEKPIQYDSHLDEILRKYGEKASDEVFEQAVAIYESKLEELELERHDEELDDDEVSEERISSLSDTQEEITVDDISPIRTASNTVYKIDEEDYDEDEFVEDTEDDDAKLKVIKGKIREKIKPVTNKIDLSSFTISEKPVSIFKAFDSNIATTQTNIADWVLYSSAVQISMSEMRGYDIEKLNPSNSSRNQYNTYRDIYKLIYDHIVNEDKPEFEKFLKLIKFTDIGHLYFAIYRSSFNAQNVLTYTCPKCSDVSVEYVKVMDMVKYSSDEVKQKVDSILTAGSEFKVDEFEIELLQISDEYVIGLREPSIFNVIFETSSLEESFRVKYADSIGLLSYIETIYVIDRDNNKLSPIQVKTYDNDLGKTMKNRVVQYSKIISSLSSDQYYSLSAAISKITREDDITYIIPEKKCEKCNAIIPEVEQSPENLLFIRHQLGALANI